MTPAVRVCAIALICAVLGLLLREAGFRGSRAVALIGIVAMLGIGASGIASILDFLTRLGADMTAGGSLGSGGSSLGGSSLGGTSLGSVLGSGGSPSAGTSTPLSTADIADSAAEIIDGATKILGLGYVFGICSDVCRELGENGVANSILVVGRVEIFLATLPYLDTLLGLVRGLVG